MRKYASVLALASRSTFYKLLALLVLTAGVETALFCWAVSRRSEVPYLSLEEAVSSSFLPIVCAAAFLLLCALLAQTGCELWGSKTGYTVRRLRVRERTITLLFSCYNTGCFLLFWFFQALVLLFLCRLYTRVLPPEASGAQTVFLAAYRNDFFHSLLPLAEWSRLVRNLFLAPALGLCAATFSFHQWHGRRGFSIGAAGALTAAVFSLPIGNAHLDFLVIFAALFVSAYQIFQISKGEGAE